MTVATTTRILPHHLSDLRASGLSDETIRDAGIHSEDNPARLAQLLGWRSYPRRLGSALVFPFRDADGVNGYCQVKPDSPRRIGGRAVKYESPRGQPPRVYFPPSVLPRLATPDAELLITEGAKKALAATQAGFACIGLAGVSSFYEPRSTRLLPELERIAWRGRRVYVAFDSDAIDKPQVADAERVLAARLAALGAIVKIIRIPAGPADADGEPTKQGIDDFLVASGPAALHRLREEATDPEPPRSGDGKAAASSLDPADAAQGFLETGKVDGRYRLQFHRGEFLLWSKGRYAPVPQHEVRGRVVSWLNESYVRLTVGITSNVIDQIRAQSLLPSAIEAPSFLGTPPVDADGQPWGTNSIVVARNGMVHLPSFVAGAADFLLPATPRFFTPAALDFDFRPDAPAPTLWLESLNQWLDDDPESIAALQEAMGYTLVLDTRQQKIFMLIGPPRSGKGTVARIWRALVGKQNTCGPTLASLATSFGLAQFLSRALATIADARLSARSDQAVIVERLLSISGEDALTIDRKFLEPVTVTLPTRIAILSNELPRLSDSSEALVNRMIVLRFLRSFLGREDHCLTERLMSELPGILLWAIEGWRRLRDRGHFVQPSASAELLGAFADLASPVGSFVRERCIVEADRKIERGELFAAYRQWAESKGQARIEDEAGFGRALRAAVPSVYDTAPRLEGRPVRHYGGIGLRAVE